MLKNIQNKMKIAVKITEMQNISDKNSINAQTNS